MLQPRRTKYRKMHRGRRKGNAQAGNQITFGEFGMKAIGRAFITARQIEAARRTITRRFRRGRQVWIRIFPDKPDTSKPLETRQGGGKAALDQWLAVVMPGRVLFEVAGVSEDVARDALWLASQKLPIKVKTVGKEDLYTA